MLTVTNVSNIIIAALQSTEGILNSIFDGISKVIKTIGDAVVGVDLHSVLKEDLNPIDGSILQTIFQAQEWCKVNGYKGLVISSDSANFSAFI